MINNTIFVKLYLDLLDDPAIRRAVRNGAKELVMLPWLLAFAKKADDGGRITIDGEPAEPVDIAPSIAGATAKKADVRRAARAVARSR